MEPRPTSMHRSEPHPMYIVRDLHLPSEDLESEESFGSKKIYIVVRQLDFPPVYKQRRLQPGDTEGELLKLDRAKKRATDHGKFY